MNGAVKYMEGNAHGRIASNMTKGQLFDIVGKEVAFAKDRDAQRVKRIDDLLAVNNRYLERARNAEKAKTNAEAELMTALDRIDFMQGEYDAAVNQHLEQQTWLRMAVERWKNRAQRFQSERAELYDKLMGTPCAEIRWKQERDKLIAHCKGWRFAWFLMAIATLTWAFAWWWK